MNNYIHPALIKLRTIASNLNVRKLADQLLEDPRFAIWSASSKPNKHHYGKHGLVIHTLDVVELVLKINDQYDCPVDPQRLFLAALFHDAGKMWDYEPLTTNPQTGSVYEPYTEWEAVSHRWMIHHIPRSALFWEKAKEKVDPIAWGIDDPTDDILHAILAHHGRKEWSSPVEPKTKMAWLLHLSDCISARMDDCEKNI